MSIDESHPDFGSIEDPIERARIERGAYLGTCFGSLIGEGGAALARAIKRLGAAMERGYNAELDARAIEADAFLRRSVPRC